MAKRHWVWVSLPLLALASTALLLQWPDAPGGPGEPEPEGPAGIASPPPAVDPQAVVRTTSQPQTQQSRDWLAEPEEPRGSGTLLGKVTWARTFAPAAELEVRLTTRWLASEQPGPEDRPFFRTPREGLLLREGTVTDAQGCFRIVEVPNDRTLFLVLAQSGSVIELRKVERTPEAGETVDLGEVLLAERGRIRGHVQPRLAKGGRVLAIDDPLFDDALLDPEAKRRALEIARRSLQPDASGRERQRLLPYPQAECAEDGSFELRGVRPGLVTVSARLRNGMRLERTCLVAAGALTEIGMLSPEPARARAPNRPGTGRHRLLDAAGHPVGGAEVVAGAENAEALAFARTDADGRFELLGPKGGPLALQARAGEGMPFEPVQRLANTFAADDGAVFQFFVRGELAIGCAGAAKLVLCSADDRLGTGSGELPGSCQPQARGGGQYVASGLPRTRVWLAVSPAEGQPSLHEIDLGRQPRVALQVEPSSGVTARILTLDRSDRPVGDTEVWAALAHGLAPPRLLGRSDAQGLLEVADLPPAAIFLCARHPRHANSPSALAHFRPGVPFVLRMLPPARLTGVLLERAERPQLRWRVQLAPTPALREQYAGSPFVETRLTISNADGTFDLHSILPGAYRLEIAHPRTEPREIDLWTAPLHHQVIELEPEHAPQLRGRVTVAGTDGKALVVRLVATGEAAGRRHASSFASHAGDFAFSGLQDGAYRLTVERRDRGFTQVLAARDLQLPAADLQLELPTGTLECFGLSGEVVLEQDPAAGGAMLQAVAGEDGMARFEGVPAGSYALGAGGRTLRCEVKRGVVTQIRR